MRDGEGESLTRQAATSLKPGGGATSGLGLGTPMAMLSQTPPLQPFCILWLLMPGPSSP